MKKLGTILVSVSVLLTLFLPMLVMPSLAATEPSYMVAQDFSGYSVGPVGGEGSGFSASNATGTIVGDSGGKYLQQTETAGQHHAFVAIPMEQTSLVEVKGIAVRFSTNNTDGWHIMCPRVHTAGDDWNDSTSWHVIPHSIWGNESFGDMTIATTHTIENGKRDTVVFEKDVSMTGCTAGALWYHSLLGPVADKAGFDGWMIFPIENFTTLDPATDQLNYFEMYTRYAMDSGNPYINIYEIGYVYDLDLFCTDHLGLTADEVKPEDAYGTAEDFSGYEVGSTGPAALFQAGSTREIINSNYGNALKITATHNYAHATTFPLSEKVSKNDIEAVVVRMKLTSDGNQYINPRLHYSGQPDNQTVGFLTDYNVNNSGSGILTSWGDMTTSVSYCVDKNGNKVTTTFTKGAGSWGHNWWGNGYDTGELFDGWLVLPIEYFPSLPDGAIIDGFNLGSACWATQTTEIYEIGYVYDLEGFFDMVGTGTEANNVLPGGNYEVAQDFSGYELGSATYTYGTAEIVDDGDGGKAYEGTPIGAGGYGTISLAPMTASQIKAVAVRVTIPNNGWNVLVPRLLSGSTAYKVRMSVEAGDTGDDASIWGDYDSSTVYTVDAAGTTKELLFIKNNIMTGDGDGYSYGTSGKWIHGFYNYSAAFDGWMIVPVESFADLAGNTTIDGFSLYATANECGGQTSTIHEIGYVYNIEDFLGKVSAGKDPTAGVITAGILNMDVLPDGKQGLRFTNVLKTTREGALDKVTVGGTTYTVKEVGALVAVNANLAGGALNLGNAMVDMRIISAKSLSYRQCVIDGDARTYTFSSIVKNIGRANKAVDIASRTFVICEDAAGNMRVFYSPTKVANLQTVYQKGTDWTSTVHAFMSDRTMKATDYIRNTEVFKTRYFGGDAAHPHVQKQGPFVDTAHHTYHIWKDGDLALTNLGQYGFFIEEELVPNSMSEWGNYFLNVDPSYSNSFINGPLLGDTQYRLEQPNTRADSVRIITDWLAKQFSVQIPDRYNVTQLNTCTGFYLWNQYALDVLHATSVGAEVGETIQHTQASMAFVRGGSRQYDVPGWMDMSHWYANNADTAYVPEWSHSASLSERTAMATIMGGGASIMAEGGEYSLIDTGSWNEVTKRYNLTEVGFAYKNVVDFIERTPDLGYAYTPFGLVLDYYHGMDRNLSEGAQKKAFGYFSYNDGDKMTEKLFDLFFPGGWGTELDETHYLVNGPYGDTCDALLQNASQEVLNSYPCLILSGDITFSNDDINRYVNYVKQGGTLIMNTAYLNSFSSYKSQYSGSGTQEITDTLGKVIVYGPDYDTSALDGIIRQQLALHMPVSVSEQVEYLVNIKDSTIYITLINNEGFVHKPGEPVLIDAAKTKNVTVTYTGDMRVIAASEIYRNDSVTVNENAATVTVEPGEVKVLQFTIV